MESSFKKQYQKAVNSDGSVELTFNSRRFRVGPQTWFLIIVVIFMASCAVTYPFIPTERHPRLGDQVNAPTWIVLSFIVTFIAVFFVDKSKDVITVKPKEGLLFRGKSLPFAEINEIGLTTYSVGASAATGAYVHAESNGQEIRITRYIPQELAKQIKREILDSSGVA